MAQILIARLVLGFGMGIINSVVPVIMAEFAPKATRGLFVCMQLSTLNFGKPSSLITTASTIYGSPSICGYLTIVRPVSAPMEIA